MIRITDTIVIKKHVASKELDGILYLLDPERGHLHTCNDSAKVIWQALENKMQVKDIITHLAREFDITQSQAKKDVISFITRMQNQNMIRVKQTG